MPSVGTILREAISLRSALRVELPQIKAWLEARKTRNQFDPAIFNYPTLEVIAATNGAEKPHVYLPVQKAAVLESVAVNPESTPTEVAHALVMAERAAEYSAHASGCREIYFLASDQNTAAGAKHLGFEEMDMKVYRKRLGGPEPNGGLDDAQ